MIKVLRIGVWCLPLCSVVSASLVSCSELGSVPGAEMGGAGMGGTAGSGGLLQTVSGGRSNPSGGTTPLGGTSPEAHSGASGTITASNSGGLSSGGSSAGAVASGGSPSGGAAGGRPSAAGMPGSTASNPRKVDYASDAVSLLANPERGFYHHEETHASNHVGLDARTLTRYRTEQGVTLILRLYYLESFRTTDISSSYLAAIGADLEAVRAAGLKVILRFAYTDKSSAPYGDAEPQQVLRHIGQLAAIVTPNSDVIMTVQAGFIGTWGEWYYTDHFGDDGRISSAQWLDRRAVVDAWLAALPVDKTLQLRTPAFKQHFFGAAALTPDEAFGSSARARVGHHNDCFLSSADDQGTYTDIMADKAYLAQENQFVPQGGETCAESEFSSFENGTAELSKLRYTYLNLDYHPGVLASWGTGLDEVRRLLGYRLALVSGEYGTASTPGAGIPISLVLRNAGYATPLGARPVQIVLRSTAGLGTFRAELPVDVRRIAPGTSHSVTALLCVPIDIPNGDYRLTLALPDHSPKLRARAEYAIRLANTAVWQSETGENDLQHTVRIAGQPTSGCGTGGVPLIAD